MTPIAARRRETLIDLLEARRWERPDDVALVFRGGPVTYSELERRANRLARVLMQGGAAPDTVIGIACERSIEMVVALLGVITSGAAYFPLDVATGPQRLAHMIATVRPHCIITTSRAAKTLALTGNLLRLDGPEIEAQLADQDDSALRDAERAAHLTGDHAAYVLFTSGSSGRPKAVVGTQRGIVNRLEWFRETWPDDARAPVLARTSLGFIDATTELLTPLCFGGLIVLADDAAAKDLEALVDLARGHDTLRVTTVPSLISALQQAWSTSELPQPRLWVSSGEPLPPVVIRRVFESDPASRLLNFYGMSEASSDSLWGDAARDGCRLATPVANTDVLLLDSNLEAVPLGMPGELYIGGTGLARGYLRQPALTAERFVADPFSSLGGRLYRTGDLARGAPDGTLEILGREDRQVKITGVRIELDEIEHVLGGLPGIAEVAVVAIRNQDVSTIVAFVTPTVTPAFDVARTRERLRSLIRAESIPARFVVLTQLPHLAVSGKVDRRSLLEQALPPPDASPADRNPDEEVLCGIFSELFGKAVESPDGDFFQLGGHSLQIVRLVNRIRACFGVELEPAVIFDVPRIRDLATHIRRLSQDSAAVSSSP